VATHAPSRAALDLPRPGRAAVPFLILCAAALGFEADPRLWPVAAASAAAFAAAGAVRALAARRELQSVRRTADRLILQHPRHAVADSLVAWRSAELTEPSQRRRLRREVEHTLAALSPARLPSASPLQRPAGRQNAELLRVLADRLDDGRPVAARGMLLAAALLRGAGSPLYSEGGDLLLPRVLTRVLGALEP
jgi:hypothetical protein